MLPVSVIETPRHSTLHWYETDKKRALCTIRVRYRRKRNQFFQKTTEHALCLIHRRKPCPTLKKESLPSSNMSRDRTGSFTKPWVSASSRTCGVETTTSTFKSAASHILCSLQRSTLSFPVRQMTVADGMLVSRTKCC